MNGRELSKATLLDCPASVETDSIAVDEEERSRWAALVTGAMLGAGAHPASLGLGDPQTAGSAPDAWRQSVGDLTPNVPSGEVLTEANPAGSKSGVSEGEGLQRIQVRVNTEEFGEVALIIERAEQGLRIVLGAVDGRVVSALRHEALAVRRAIENGGQTVGSFEIVRMNEVGTNLAQPRLAPGNRVRRLREQANLAVGPEDRNKKKSRRINLIG